jgi:2-keto-3-deoxy-L-fuconate dehydrogenase
MFRLDNKIAVVTGGGSGIGKAIATVLAAQGATVHIVDLTAEQTAQSHPCDVSNQQQVTEVFNKIGNIDILVNSAGIAHIGNAENTSEQDFARVINVNIKGVYNCLHAALPLMKKNGKGAIVNISSIAAHIGLEDRFAYSMSKGAVHAMTMSVARDFLKTGIRCNSISPARVHTSFVDGFIAKNYPGKEKEMFAKLSAAQPIGRMGSVDEIASLALYLSSDEAGFVTGVDYLIDGGAVKLNG